MSMNFLRFSSPRISILSFSMMRFVAIAAFLHIQLVAHALVTALSYMAGHHSPDPAVFLQFIQRQICPRRRLKRSGSLIRTVIAPQRQVPSIMAFDN